MQPIQGQGSGNQAHEFTRAPGGSLTYQYRRGCGKGQRPNKTMLGPEDLCQELFSQNERSDRGTSGTFMQPDLHKPDHGRDIFPSNSKPVIVKAKPIAPSIARKLPGGYFGKDFVKSTPSLHSSAKDEGTEGQPSSLPRQKDSLNKLSAQLLRAEIMGNAALIQKLKADLRCQASMTEGKKAQDSQGASAGVALVKFDSRKGTAIPAATFEESDGGSVRELLRKEKTMSAAEDFELYTAFPKAKPSKVSEDWTVDDVISERKRKVAPELEKNRKKQVLIKEYERTEQILSKCLYCFGSSRMNRHLVVAVGLQTYLALPPCRPLVSGHCCIMPRDHVSSSVQMDEDVFEETKMWRKGLVAMFRASGKECIFMENARNVHHMPHTCVECFPVPADVAVNAPAFFKKAIMECDEEWASNRRLIDLSQRDIRKSVPRGFSYFAVEFGLRGGFAHVIEDEGLVSTWFGQEVLGGMLNLDYTAWRNPEPENFQVQLNRTKEFKKQWAPYDWTEEAESHPLNAP